MRKKILAMMFFAVLGLLVVSSGVYAAYPGIGSSVEFNNSYGTLAGEYEMWSGDLSYQYANTFCVERGEYLNFNNEFIVNAYETPAPQTAFLYYAFVKGDLYSYNYGSDADANELQEAIWSFQGQSYTPLDGDATNFNFYVHYATMVYDAYTDSNWQSNIPQSMFDDYAFAQTNVKILDLKTLAGGNAQDVLGVSAVPEPMTMLLLGFGLVGLAGLRRKM